MRIAFRERSAVFDFSETRFLISVFGWIQLLQEHKELSLLRQSAKGQTAVQFVVLLLRALALARALAETHSERHAGEAHRGGH